MFIGGCAGSTAGGIKVIRVIIIFRTVFEDVFRMVHPRAVTPLRIRDRVLPEGVRVAVLGLDRDLRSWHLPCRHPTRARPVLLGDGRRRYAERDRARIGAGWCLRELRGGKRLRTCGAHSVYAARPPGNLHDPGALLPGVLEKVNRHRFVSAALEYITRPAVKASAAQRHVPKRWKGMELYQYGQE